MGTMCFHCVRNPRIKKSRIRIRPTPREILYYFQILTSRWVQIALYKGESYVSIYDANRFYSVIDIANLMRVHQKCIF